MKQATRLLREAVVAKNRRRPERYYPSSTYGTHVPVAHAVLKSGPLKLVHDHVELESPLDDGWGRRGSRWGRGRHRASA